jgi:hypothetical protein
VSPPGRPPALVEVGSQADDEPSIIDDSLCDVQVVRLTHAALLLMVQLLMILMSSILVLHYSAPFSSLHRSFQSHQQPLQQQFWSRGTLATCIFCQ